MVLIVVGDESARIVGKARSGGIHLMIRGNLLVVLAEPWKARNLSCAFLSPLVVYWSWRSSVCVSVRPLPLGRLNAVALSGNFVPFSAFVLVRARRQLMRTVSSQIIECYHASSISLRARTPIRRRRLSADTRL